MLRNNLIRLTEHLSLGRLALGTSKPEVCSHVFKKWFASKESDEKDDNIFGILNDRVLKKVGDKLSDLKEQNGFQLFDLEQKFTINSRKLQREMHNLQRIIHPDKFIDADRRSQEISDYLSALVNDFYHVLDHPYERAKYLLSLISNKSQTDIEKSLDTLKMDQDFLTQMMDIQEKLDDPSTGSRALTQIFALLSQELDELSLELDRDFQEKNIDDILGKLGKLKFLANCHRKAAERTDSFSRF